MFSSSSIPATIVASTATIEQLGERHKFLVKSANARRRISLSKHEWTQGELTDVCIAFMQGHQEDKPLHKIAQEINAHFAEYLIQQDREEESDDDAPLVGPHATPATAPAPALNEFREGLPSTNAIEMKLIDCVALERNCNTFGAKPSKMHTEVWQHLIQAQKHREMIRTMKEAPARAPSPASTPSSRLGKVHRRKESENDRADFPSAKRRKLNPDEEDAATMKLSNTTTTDTDDQKFMEMQELCNALDTIASQIEAREQDHERANLAIARSLATIRQNKEDIVLLTGYIQDTQSGINKCVERIDVEIERVERILAERRAAIATVITPAYVASTCASACASASASASACASATYETNEASDTERIDEEEDTVAAGKEGNYYGEYELDYDSSGWDEQPSRGGDYCGYSYGCGYDHAEECS